METWDIRALDVQPHHPEVLSSDEEGRVIVIQLPAGERLQEHQVHEGAWLLVVSGEVEINGTEGSTAKGGEGFFAHFRKNERREIVATQDSRLLLLLTPWPGPGHPSEGR
jgi:quercetin dioxygenase-like cupin family protein